MDSTLVAIPVSFGEVTITIVAPDGTVTVETELALAKGGGNVEARNPRPMLSCTFGDTFEFDGFTVTVSGTVVGFLTGR